MIHDIDMSQTSSSGKDCTQASGTGDIAAALMSFGDVVYLGLPQGLEEGPAVYIEEGPDDEGDFMTQEVYVYQPEAYGQENGSTAREHHRETPANKVEPLKMNSTFVRAV